MKIYLVMTEFDRSQYCEPDIDVDVEAAFDSEEKAKQYINDTLVAELIEEERNRTCVSSEWKDDVYTIEFDDYFTIKIKVIGLGDNVLKYQYATENGRKEINIVEGENELPTSIKVSNDYQIGYRLTPLLYPTHQAVWKTPVMVLLAQS